MTTSTTKFALIITAAALTIAVLTGCTSMTAIDTTPTVSKTSAAAPAKPETAETGSVAIGAALTDAQVKALGKDFKNPDRPYKLADGSYIKVNRNEPLPVNAKADIAVKTAAAAVVSSTTNDMGDAVLTAKSAAQTQTGRQIALVVYMDEKEFGWAWIAAVSEMVQSPYFTTPDEAIAFAQNYIAAQANPTAWDIVVSK